MPTSSAELRALQAPLKKRYQEKPSAALVTLFSEGRIGEEITCRVSTGKSVVEAGLHPAAGGDGSLICSEHMLLEALAACAGVTLRAVATALDIPVSGGTVRAEGDIDFRGALGVSKDAPVGLQRIRLSFQLETTANEDQLDTLLQLTERYCVVQQTLLNPPAVTIELQGRQS